MQAKTIKGHSIEAIKSAFSESISDNFKPTLAIVFLSIKQDWETVCKIFEDPKIAIFGATTSGEFIDGDIEEGSITVMLLDINPDYFTLKFFETGEKSTFENAKQLGAEGKNTFKNPAFLIVTGWLTEEGENIVEGITAGFGMPAPSKDGVTIFGGMAGDDLSLSGPMVFTKDKSSDKGLLALIIDEDKIEINGIATCGWKAIGTTKTITKSKGNIVYTIDDKPALDMIIKYLGVDYNFSTGNEIVTQIGAYYPLQMEREGVAPVMRTAMLANREDRSLICAGNVPQGSKVKFSLPPDFDAIETVIEECNELKQEHQQEADALIMFSCISRHLSFGILMSEEISQVKQVWDAPMVGFFTYGEFGKSKTGKHEFHNNTCCVVALKEKYNGY
ncbi:FIST N-terminal domain-containing protein [Aequorivita todarodis]|uniref:FIST signal transduction protein n=1 Tax=Aequorivita todarodis TaxID=2036821 RepID=UPI002350E82E|nr:FIST N-terminal domain-containing protein [Aequorivita todarodis]MDC7999526.1 FIST N-terminal domain-containing protein [Aequorivita todarodis]